MSDLNQSRFHAPGLGMNGGSGPVRQPLPQWNNNSQGMSQNPQDMVQNQMFNMSYQQRQMRPPLTSDPMGATATFDNPIDISAVRHVQPLSFTGGARPRFEAEVRPSSMSTITPDNLNGLMEKAISELTVAELSLIHI